MPGVEVRESHAMSGERVQVWCWQLRTVAAEVTEAKVVADHEDDVRTAL